MTYSLFRLRLFHNSTKRYWTQTQRRMLTNNLQTLTIQFNNDISQWEVPLFRGAVIGAMENTNILFHNHLDDDTFRYRYPLIQYKRIKSKAAMVCVGEGTEVIGEFFSCANFNLQVGERQLALEVDHMDAKRTLVQVWDTEFRYTLRKWLPLSSDNYRTYQTLDGLVVQYAFLQNILIGNILSFCKGLGITIEKEIKCTITQLLDSHTYTFKGVKMMGFDVEFKANISLPDYVGLGKGVSLGFGTVVKKYENRKNNNE